MANALSQNIADLESLSKLLSGSAGGRTTTTKQTQMSPEAVDALLKSLMENPNTGRAITASQQKVPGLYNTTTQQMLMNDLMVRSAGQVALAASPEVTVQQAPTADVGQMLVGLAAATAGKKALGSVWKKVAGDRTDRAAEIVEKGFPTSAAPTAPAPAPVPVSAPSAIDTAMVSKPYNVDVQFTGGGVQPTTVIQPAQLAGQSITAPPELGVVVDKAFTQLSQTPQGVQTFPYAQEGITETPIDITGAATGPTITTFDGAVYNPVASKITPMPSITSADMMASQVSGFDQADIDAWSGTSGATSATSATSAIGGINWAPTPGQWGGLALGTALALKDGKLSKQEVGGIAGGYGGMKLGASYGSAFGPVGTVVGGILGSIIGGKALSKCFITTAVCELSGKPDDCHELTVLRKFRDEYMVPNYPDEVIQYYAEAPALVNTIRNLPLGDSIFESFRLVYIEPAVSAIEAGDNEKARKIYSELFQYAKHLGGTE